MAKIKDCTVTVYIEGTGGGGSTRVFEGQYANVALAALQNGQDIYTYYTEDSEDTLIYIPYHAILLATVECEAVEYEAPVDEMCLAGE